MAETRKVRSCSAESQGEGGSAMEQGLRGNNVVRVTTLYSHVRLMQIHEGENSENG